MSDDEEQALREVRAWNAEMKQAADERRGEVPEFSGGDPVITAPFPGDAWKFALAPYVKRRRVREGDDTGGRRQRQRTEDAVAEQLGSVRVGEEEEEVDEKGAPMYRDVPSEADVPEEPPEDEPEDGSDDDDEPPDPGEPKEPSISDIPFCAICHFEYNKDNQHHNNLRAILGKHGTTRDDFVFVHAQKYYDEHMRCVLLFYACYCRAYRLLGTDTSSPTHPSGRCSESESM